MASPDLSVFGKQKTLLDQQALQAAFDLKKQLIMKQATGLGQLPAPIQIANEIARARSVGDTQRVNDLVTTAKLYDRGIVTDAIGNPVALQGYAPAIGMIEATKAGMKEQATSNVDLNMKPLIERGVSDQRNASDLNFGPQIKRAETVASAMGKTDAANNATVSSAPGAIGTFDALETSARNAPSGKFDNFTAGIANYYPSVSTESTRKNAAGQGDFNVKRGAAENEIRSTFRIAGSGTQTDADAKPIIDMLPNVTDSLEVKQSKIAAAKSALMDRANARAAASGLASPFGSSTPMTVEVNAVPIEATKNIGGVNYVKRGGQWFAQ